MFLLCPLEPCDFLCPEKAVRQTGRCVEQEAISRHGAADHRGTWAAHQQGLRRLINLLIHQKLNVSLGRVFTGSW